MNAHSFVVLAQAHEAGESPVGGVNAHNVHERLDSLRVVVGERLESSAQINSDRLTTALEALRQCDEQGGSRPSLVGLVSVLLDEFAADVRSAIEVDCADSDDRALELSSDLQRLGHQFAADSRALNAGDIGSREFMPGAEFTTHACVQSLAMLRDRARDMQTAADQHAAEPRRERMH